MSVGLAERTGNRTLYLTKGPFASSLYVPNEAILRDFTVWEWYELVGQATVNVDTLDTCIARSEGWIPDFIKVDVEGSDIDVLKGGAKGLQNAFGLQVEVSFINRNIGAPLYWEAERWIREAGFYPHLLIGEHWLRSNGAYGPLSRPQLAWADAVCFRNRTWVLTRLEKAANQEAAERDLAAFIAILLVFGAHDYALELANAASSAQLTSDSFVREAKESIHRSVPGYWLFALRGSAALAVALLLALPLMFASSRGRLVARGLIARQAAPLFDAMARAARRSGPARSLLPDQ